MYQYSLSEFLASGCFAPSAPTRTAGKYLVFGTYVAPTRVLWLPRLLTRFVLDLTVGSTFFGLFDPLAPAGCFGTCPSCMFELWVVPRNARPAAIFKT
ncbi:hypothetical protein U1Q18_000611 [Sarracenia purpurea var. burkii]